MNIVDLSGSLFLLFIFDNVKKKGRSTVYKLDLIKFA